VFSMISTKSEQSLDSAMWQGDPGIHGYTS
jgi:hypothetical protein